MGLRQAIISQRTCHQNIFALPTRTLPNNNRKTRLTHCHPFASRDMLFGPQHVDDANEPRSIINNDAGSSIIRKKSSLLSDVGTKKRRQMSVIPSTIDVKSRKDRHPKNPLDGSNACIYPSVWAALKYKSVDNTKIPPAVHLDATRIKTPVCVTGIDGFVAAWIVTELLERGYKVRGTIESKSHDISRLTSLPQAATHLSVVETSLLTPESCDVAVDGCEFVFHTGTPSSCAVRDPLSEAKVDIIILIILIIIVTPTMIIIVFDLHYRRTYEQ
jgi:hypothetical protein